MIVRFLAALVFTASVHGQDITLRIEIAKDAPPQFRIGEIIPLNLVFERSSGPEATILSIDGNSRSVLGLGRDRFVISPDSGTRDPWEYRRSGGIVYSGPGGRMLRETITVIPVELNQWVRFERAGHYSIHAEFQPATRGLQALPPVVSNEIGIDITEADPAWQAEQLQKGPRRIRQPLREPGLRQAGGGAPDHVSGYARIGTRNGAITRLPGQPAQLFVR